MNSRVGTGSTQNRKEPTVLVRTISRSEGDAARAPRKHASSNRAKVALLTGGGDKPYAIGLALALSAAGVAIDFVGSDDLDVPELRRISSLNFLNLRCDMRPGASMTTKVWRVLIYYFRLFLYAATAKPKVFHILWNNKLALLDRTLVILYYRLLGKRIAFTAHNVNAGQRDGNDTILNRLSLRSQYHLVDHIFVHTQQMKRELQTQFGVDDRKVSVIPFGINSTVSNTALTSAQAKQTLGLTSEKVMLFFGNIAPYKGLEYLIEAVTLLVQKDPDYRLIIVGCPKGCASYWEPIQHRISCPSLSPYVIQRIEYVPDADTEIYFKAADVLVLPYTHIFQSGVLFLAYNFGLPVIASDVGSLKEDVIEGETGFVCKPRDPISLATSVEAYFHSTLYRQLNSRRQQIQNFANEKYSWTKVGEITQTVYTSLVAAGLKRLGDSTDRKQRRRRRERLE
jgi:glycosyltransferase involved in cell wall biosynthesis